MRFINSLISTYTMHKDSNRHMHVMKRFSIIRQISDYYNTPQFIHELNIRLCCTNSTERWCYYAIISVTTPVPTVLCPSLRVKRWFSSSGISDFRVKVSLASSPGITISLPGWESTCSSRYTPDSLSLSLSLSPFHSLSLSLSPLPSLSSLPCKRLNQGEPVYSTCWSIRRSFAILSQLRLIILRILSIECSWKRYIF